MKTVEFVWEKSCIFIVWNWVNYNKGYWEKGGGKLHTICRRNWWCIVLYTDCHFGWSGVFGCVWIVVLGEKQL